MSAPKGYVVTCACCKQAFEAVQANQYYCSACRAKYGRSVYNHGAAQERQREDRAALSKGRKCGKIISNNVIMSALTKPDGCSDVRWRIELRRRQNESYYGNYGDVVK